MRCDGAKFRSLSKGILSSDQIHSFVENGWCVLPGAFTSAQAERASSRVLSRMERKAHILRDDPSTWPDVYDIEERLGEPAVLDCFTDRLADAVIALVGEGQWVGERRWGLWPVNFSVGAKEPYDIPDWGWHIDGNWFPHRLDCPLQGLLVIGLFTDTGPRGGGTILAGGSHKTTARVLARHPEGISHLGLFAETLKEPLGNFYEVTGAAGDVVLAHPFLFHTRGMKHCGPPRIISNTEAPLRRPIRVDGAQADGLSTLERAIVQALQELPDPPPPDAKKCRF
jgi:hypothetical protein